MKNSFSLNYLHQLYIFTSVSVLFWFWKILEDYILKFWREISAYTYNNPLHWQQVLLIHKYNCRFSKVANHGTSITYHNTRLCPHFWRNHKSNGYKKCIQVIFSLQKLVASYSESSQKVEMCHTKNPNQRSFDSSRFSRNYGKRRGQKRTKRSMFSIETIFGGQTHT